MEKRPYKKYLLAPGPTPIPESVLLKAAESIIHHRTPQFEAIFKQVSIDLQYVHQTTQPVYIFASSGTGAMEASISNLLNPGEKALYINGGKFGERWGQMLTAYGVEKVEHKIPWTTAPKPEDIKKALDADPAIKAVYTQLVETSSGALFDVEGIAKITRARDVMLIVDAISSLGGAQIKMDDWGVDVIVSGSQKAFMLPPGLGFIAFSERAWKRVEECKQPRFYFDVRKYKKNLAANTTPFTPAIHLVIQLQESLRLIKEEGLENIFSRCIQHRDAVIAATQAIGLKLLNDSPSPVVTAILLPEGIDGGKVPKMLRDDLGITIAGGQDDYKGKIVRFAHMGHIVDFDMVAGMGALEVALARLGYKFEVGKGTSTMLKTLFKV